MTINSYKDEFTIEGKPDAFDWFKAAACQRSHEWIRFENVARLMHHVLPKHSQKAEVQRFVREKRLTPFI